MANMNEALLDMSTQVPYDARFSNHNVMKGCWYNYIRFQACKTTFQGDQEPCAREAFAVNNMCARRQVEQWDALRKKAAFAGIPIEHQGKNAPDYDPEEDDE